MKMGSRSKCPLAEGWIKKILHTHTHTHTQRNTIEPWKRYHAIHSKWMNLEIITLNELSQRKDKYNMISLICRI